MNNIKLLKATRSFFKNFNWTDPIAVTLTFKKGIMVEKHLVFASGDAYRQNVRHFLNVLNKEIYRGLSRKGWLMSVVSVVETGAFDGLHYHLMLDKPPHLGFEHYAALIHKAWSKTQWGHDLVHISPDGGECWINYMTKLKTKSHYDEAIDWTNTHAAAIPLSEVPVPLRLRINRRADALFRPGS